MQSYCVIFKFSNNSSPPEDIFTDLKKLGRAVHVYDHFYIVATDEDPKKIYLRAQKHQGQTGEVFVVKATPPWAADIVGEPKIELDEWIKP